MRAKQHLISSVPVAGITYYLSGNFFLSAIVLISHIFIDLDHLLDYAYYSYKNKEKLSVKKFFEVCYNSKLKKIFLILHSYELFAIMIGFSLLYKNILLYGLIIGGLSHLALDAIFNGNSRYSYFLIYRLSNKFSADSFYEKSNSCKTV